MAVINTSQLRQPVGETGVEMGSTDIAGTSVGASKLPKGFDWTELLQAAMGEALCPVPHWFVITKGAVGVRYVDDGTEETGRQGDVIYLRPGHTIWAEEDSELVEISPADGSSFLIGRIQATGLLG